jgi:uncharacterized protein (DUF427 family)
MKVFIAGASGAIGSAVVGELVDRGHEVTGLTRAAALYGSRRAHNDQALLTSGGQDRRAVTDKPIKEPGPDHPITIEANHDRVVVAVAGRVLADTRDALTLREAGYRPVQYIPLSDVDVSLLEPTEHTTYCPYKGHCSYTPFPSVARNQSTPCGPIRLRLPPSPRSRIGSPSTPIVSMR